MKVYIAGKISYLPKEVYVENFKKVERKLVEIGIPKRNIKNPVEFGIDDQTGTYDALELCLPHFKECDAVFFLDNWKESTGAMVEHSWAERMGMERFYESYDGYNRLKNALMPAV